MVNEIRKILTGEDSDEFLRPKEAFIRAFFREKELLFVDSTVSNHSALHSNFIPLFYGLVPDEGIKSIVELIRKKRLHCGVYNSYFLLKGLARVGEHDLVYELITSRDERSWANMIQEGATTCFEAWGKEQKWNTSLCHPWASSPIPVIIEDILGLKPGKPGWEEIEFRPHIPHCLDSISLEIQTAAGNIKVCSKNGKVTMETWQS